MNLSKIFCPKSHSGYREKEDLKTAKFPECYNEGKLIIQSFVESGWILTVKVERTNTTGTSRFGSGIIVDVQLISDTFCDCSTSSGKCRLGYIDIKTASHVVRNDEEAKITTCSLFHDSKDSEGITLRGHKVIKSNVENDTCIFRCYTCRQELLKHLCDTLKQFHSSRDDLKSKYGNVREDDMTAVVISHPHGGPKQWSMGPCKFEFRDGGCSISHQASTCPGSSGAAVLVIGGQKTVVHSKSDGCIGLSSQLTSSESEGEEDAVGLVSH